MCRLAEELMAIGARLGEGSEAPYAHALLAVCALAAAPPPDFDARLAELEAALEALRAADAKQRLTHVLLCAAEADLRHGRAAAAHAHAGEALALAELLERPSDVVLARVALARAAGLAGDAAMARRQAAQLGPALLRQASAQARAAAAALDAPPRRRRR
ncbi:MAG: hypothetical protein U0802_20795 [Candidatus Binatia bacterium]